MGLSLDSILAAGSAAVVCVEDIVNDVKAGIASGGGVLAESAAVAKALVSDVAFEAKLAALVEALKVL